MKIAVIIPFFQRRQGLLATAVASVAAQQIAADTAIDIIVVDDGSPVSAIAEPIATLPDHCALRIMTRPNGGVAAARNTGLDAVAPDTDYIAFLDSDDIWSPGHIASAVESLAEGADFYFDNNMFEVELDNFGHFRYMVERHTQGYRAPPVRRQIDRNEAFDAVVDACIPHMSQIVYNFAAHRALRFDESQKLAGEDHLFCLELAHRSRATAYNTAIMGHRGRGVSIYRETLSWDSPNGLNRLIDQMVMRKKMLANYELSLSQRAALRSALQRSCTHFVFLSLRNGVRQPRTVAAALARITREVPQIWQMMPIALHRLPAHRAELASGG